MKVTEILSEQIDLKSLPAKLKPLYVRVNDKYSQNGDGVVQLLIAGIENKHIWNVDFGEAKDFLTRYFEKTIKAVLGSLDHDDARQFYLQDISDYTYLNQAKGKLDKLKKISVAPHFSDAVKKAAKDLIEVFEAADLAFKALKEVKPFVVKGRKPNTNKDPNAFYSKLGSKEAQELVIKTLKEGIKAPLDEYEARLVKYFKSQIDNIKEMAKKGDITVDVKGYHPFDQFVFQSCFEYKITDDWKNKKKTYHDVKQIARANGFPEKEAAHIRDGLEARFLSKNVKKLSNVVDLKGNLEKIEHLAKRDIVISGRSGSIEAGFKFVFGDNSSFEVINKIVNKYSHTGKPFEQYPTTFHQVTFPDGTKMKTPSEEKIVKEFGEWKPAA